MDDALELRYYGHGNRNARKIALTFDDGPNPPRTEEVLRILADAGAHATFFVLGKWADRWPRTLERIRAGGHVVGNHGYAHGFHLSDYERAEAAISHVTGVPTTFLRAAFYQYGACVASPLAHSRVLIDQDIASDDWQLSDPDDICRAVLQNPHLTAGSIIGFHDGAELDDDAQRVSRPAAMIEALPRIVAGLQSRGFELVGLDNFELDTPFVWRGGRDPSDPQALGTKADAEPSPSASHDQDVYQVHKRRGILGA